MCRVPKKAIVGDLRRVRERSGEEHLSQTGLTREDEGLEPWTTLLEKFPPKRNRKHQGKDERNRRMQLTNLKATAFN